MRKLWQFPGGLRLPGHKRESTRTPIRSLPIPPRLVLPLQQHIGIPAQALVKIGEPVLKGQRIARAKGYVCAPIHAPTSGVVVDVGEYPVPHPSGLSAPCIVIESDGRDQWADRFPVTRLDRMEPADLRTRIREAGIVGLGGAGFPSFIKLKPSSRHPLHTLIINAAECEPYITCDDMLMRERAADVVEGIEIMRRAVLAPECVVGIEDNKPEAREALEKAAAASDARVEIVAIPTLYPGGGEKQIVYTLTGKEVPSNGLPAHIGVACHNVATAYAVYRAIYHGEPLISRIVTVVGDGAPQPGNFEVLVGTPADWLLRQCKVEPSKIERLILGGPMMGFTLRCDSVPLTKTSNCLLPRTAAGLPPAKPVLPCIRCGRCTDVCPARLLPQQLYWHARAKELDKVQEQRLFDCIECGCCAAVCPSDIPLVQYYRFAKTEIYAQERERRRADQARQRHEARLERLEREQRERAERLKKKKAALAGGKGTAKAAGADPNAAKKAAIQAALERAKAKRAAARPKNVDRLTPAQQRQIEAVDRRRSLTGSRTEASAPRPTGAPEPNGAADAEHPGGGTEAAPAAPRRPSPTAGNNG